MAGVNRGYRRGTIEAQQGYKIVTEAVAVAMESIEVVVELCWGWWNCGGGGGGFVVAVVELWWWNRGGGGGDGRMVVELCTL